MIALQNVTKIYPPDRLVFRDISLNLSRGDFVLLTGPAGCGKSVLFRMILRYESPTHGKLIVFGRDTAQLKANEIPFLRRRIGYISQDPKLMRPRTVLENLTNILHATGIQGQEAEKKAKSSLESLDLETCQQIYPSDLSRSQQQKLVIARALVVQPAILLADEPLSYLENEDANKVTKLFEDINRQGTMILWASQKLDEMDKEKKRVVEFKNGAIQITEPKISPVNQTKEEHVSTSNED